MNRILLAAALAVLLAGCTAGSSRATRTDSATPPGGELVRVTRVIDGDTIVIEGGEHVRYVGVDTPETVKPETAVQCYGKEASDRNKQLVEGKQVVLVRDTSDRDDFGRLLRYVYVDGIDVSGALIRDGFGYVYSKKPDTAHLQEYGKLEREARARGAGLWSACRK